MLFGPWSRGTGTYADSMKVHEVNFGAKLHTCSGPLNTVPSLEGRPVFVQAGGFPRGRAIAARDADSIIATVNGVDGVKRH